MVRSGDNLAALIKINNRKTAIWATGRQLLTEVKKLTDFLFIICQEPLIVVMRPGSHNSQRAIPFRQDCVSSFFRNYHAT